MIMCKLFNVSVRIPLLTLFVGIGLARSLKKFLICRMFFFSVAAEGTEIVADLF